MRTCPHCEVSLLAPPTEGQLCPSCKQPLTQGNGAATGVIPQGVSEDDPTNPQIEDPAAVEGAVPVTLHVPPPPKKNAAAIVFESDDPVEAAREIWAQLKNR